MRLVSLVLLLAALAVTRPVMAAPSDADVAALARQSDALARQLDGITRAPTADEQRRLAEEHWRAMQQHLSWMYQLGCPGCGMGVMNAPAMRGYGMMSSGSMRGPGMYGGMQGSRMMGCPMMGGGPGGVWSMPSMSPSAYSSALQPRMKAMHEQMARIQAATDPVERERLLSEYWNGMYRSMQEMRGMGWMWNPPEQAMRSLPDPSSHGAHLVGQYCSQCHAAPSPSLHTAGEWADVAARMRGHMQDTARGGGQGVRIPSGDDFDAIVAYLASHAH